MSNALVIYCNYSVWVCVCADVLRTQAHTMANNQPNMTNWYLHKVWIYVYKVSVTAGNITKRNKKINTKRRNGVVCLAHNATLLLLIKLKTIECGYEHSFYSTDRFVFNNTWLSSRHLAFDFSYWWGLHV